MEKLNYAAILILVFGIIQVHSYPQNVNILNGAASVESRHDSYEGEVDHSFSDDEKSSESFSEVKPAHHVDGRIKRTPGGPKNTDDLLKKLLKEIKRAGEHTRVLPNPTPQELEQRDLTNEFNSIVNRLEALYDLNTDDAYRRAARENDDLLNRLYRAYGIVRL